MRRLHRSARITANAAVAAVTGGASTPAREIAGITLFARRLRRGSLDQLGRAAHQIAEVGGQRLLIQTHADVALDILEERTLIGCTQGNRPTFTARTRGAPDAVDILFRHVGQLVIEHMAHGRNVQAARGDVGGHQHAQFTGTERRKCLCALRLAAVAMDGARINLVRCQLAYDAVRAVLGAGEHDAAGHAFFFQKMGEQSQFLRLGNMDHRLHHAVSRGDSALHGHLYGILQILLCQCFDGRRHGRGKQHRLALTRQHAGDALEIRQKAQIQHLIAFVQHQHFDMAQIDGALHDQIDQAARAGHQHIDALLHGAFLPADRHAAKHGSDRQAHIARVGFKTGADLPGQFARRCQHQHARGHLQAMFWCSSKAVQDRQCKGRGLAGASLRQTHHVVPGQRRRNGGLLDWTWRGITLVGDGTSQRFRKREIRKIHESVFPTISIARTAPCQPGVSHRQRP